MKRILLLFPLIVFLSCTGDSDISPEDIFVKFYGDQDATLTLTDMIMRADGQEGVVLFGTRDGTVPTDASDEDITITSFFVVLTDQVGAVDNKQRIQFINDKDGFEESLDASKITPLVDGGYLVIGTSSLPNLDDSGDVSYAIWAELNDSFEVVGDWQAVGDSVSNYYGVDINVTDDGGVLAAGYTDTNGSNDLFYHKVGGTNDDWARNPPRAGSDDQLVRMLPTEDGEFLLVGRTDALSEDGETGINVERTLIDQEGVIQNSLVYGTSDGVNTDYDDIPYDVIEKPGGFAIVGEAISSDDNSTPFLMNVDLTGLATKELNYTIEFRDASAFGEGRAYSITQTLSNDYVIVGEILKYDVMDKKGNFLKTRNGEAMIMPINQGGTQIGGIKNYGVENDDDTAIRVLTAPDGSILVGAIYDFGGGLKQFALLKMNVEGELRK